MRSIADAKMKWMALQSEVKSEECARKRSMHQTGGGSAPPPLKPLSQAVSMHMRLFCFLIVYRRNVYRLKIDRCICLHINIKYVS